MSRDPLLQEILAQLERKIMPAGIIVPFGGLIPPPGWMLCNAQAVIRAQEPDLFDALVMKDKYVARTGGMVLDVEVSSTFWAVGMPVAGPTIPAFTVIDNISGQVITISNPATVDGAVREIFVGPYGFGSSVAGEEFLLPNLVGKVPFGFGGSHPIGDMEGSETHVLTTAQLPSHSHATFANQQTNTPATGGGTRLVSLQSAAGDAPNGGTGSAGSGAAHPNMQPSLAVNYLIKT